MKIRKFYESIESNDKRIVITYQKIIPSDDEYDDVEDVEDGWKDEDGESMIPDEDEKEDDITAVDKAVEFLKNKIYTTEPSSSEFKIGIYYSSTDPDIDYSNSEETYYASHLKGFTPEEELEIYKKITNWEEKEFKKTINKYNL